MKVYSAQLVKVFPNAATIIQGSTDHCIFNRSYQLKQKVNALSMLKLSIKITERCQLIVLLSFH